MKKLYLLLIIFSISSVYFVPKFSDAFEIYTNQGAKLNYVIQNVLNCQAQNNYWKNNWGGYGVWAPPSITLRAQGEVNYVAGSFRNPGSYTFYLGCTDDDKPDFLATSATLIVLPSVATPTGLNSYCNIPANTQATLSWGPVSGADNYRVTISKPSSGCPSLWSDLGVACVAYLTTNSVSFATQSGFNYNWSVQSRSGTVTSPSSVTRSISCTVPPPPPAPPAPTDLNYTCDPRGNAVTLNWSPVAGAVGGYHVRLSYSSNGPGEDQSTNNHPATSVRYPVIPGVSNTVWLHSVDGIGQYSIPAASLPPFTCYAPAVPLPPTTLTHVCNPAGTEVTLQWPAMTDATSYHVRLNNVATPQYPDSYNNNFAGTEVTYPITPGATYNAWVHSVNWVDAYSTETYSTPLPFSCNPPPPLAPTNISYTCNGAGDSVTLVWPPVADATLGYNVRLDNPSTPTDPDQSRINHLATSVTFPITPGVAHNASIQSVNTWGASAVPTNQSIICNVPATACPAGVNKTWTVGANTCSGPTPLTLSGTNGSISDSISPTTGSAQYSCTNGTWSVSALPGSTCTAPVAGTPDLVVQSHNLSSYSNLTQDQPITLAGRLRNNGTVSTGMNVYTNFSYRWGALGGYTTIREFSKGIVGATTNSTQDTVSFTPNQAGQLFLQYCVDSRNQITETGGEGNNCVQVGPITVSAPVVSGPGTPRGTIGAASCDILPGNTDCQTTVVWESFDFTGTPEVLQGTNVFSTEPSRVIPNGVTRTVSQIDSTFTLRDTGSGYTVSTNALANCLSGSVWVPGLGICAELPQIDVVADPDVIRSGEQAKLEIEIDSTYDLTCTIKDGGLDIPFNHRGNPNPVMVNPPMKTRPLNSAQIVTIICTSPTYPQLTGESSTRVNVVPTFQEI